MMLRRFARVIAVFFAINVSVQVAGAACIMPGNHTASSTSHDGSPPMAGMNQMTSPIIDSSSDRTPHDSPCDAPGIPGNCASFAPCGSALLGFAQEAGARSEIVRTPLATLVVLAPATHAVLPELPPPKA